MSLYIEKIFNKGAQSIVKIYFPLADGSGFKTLKAYTDTDIDITLKNNWGPLIPDISTLSDMSQILGSPNIVTFISASKAGWKGTDPISLPLQFYLFSYKKGMNIKSDILDLMKLATLYTGSGDNIIDETTVKVHGGYNVQLWENNVDAISNYVNSSSENLAENNEGTISITVGNQFKLRHLLLEDITVTHSSIQVEEGIPLFIKVSANFRTNRAAVSSDLDRLYL